MVSRAGGHDEQERMRRIFAADRDALPQDGGPEFNRLIFATSPYLLQHADNPVDWRQWGDDAFATARAEDKPVFLSIGYATCHWCHVMAHESFADREVAAALNKDFIAIKVDREERPDIDETYMRVAQMMSGSGGWPLNVVMTPDLEPFFVATYIPKQGRMGMLGLIDILERIAGVWRTRRELVRQNCDAMVAALARMAQPEPGDIEAGDIAREACQQLAAIYDPAWGGFGGAPKFPMPHYISFLLHCGKRYLDPTASAMAEQTLEMMRCGGIHDQLGHGLHRYSVDSRWLVPHFEKMLYDQALVASACLEAYQVSGRESFSEMAAEICGFVLREMTSPEGGFYSGLDADSEGGEGTFYLWTPGEVGQILGEDAPIFCRLFGVTEQGNFEGANILHLPVPPDEFARREGIAPESLREMMAHWRELLKERREKRERPFRDQKVLTGWNGLMIAALAKAFLVCGDRRFLEAARQSVAFVFRYLRTPDGRLLRSHHRGEGNVPAFLEDYAFFVQGLIGLYEATLDRSCLDDALGCTTDMLRLFGGDDGGLYETGSDAETVLVRVKSAHDGVIPSGNAVAALNLLRLGKITGDSGLLAAGEGIVRAFMGTVAQQPLASLQMLRAREYLLGPDVEITVARGAHDNEALEMLRAVGRRFIPGLVIRSVDGSRDFPALDGRTAAYVCAGGACRPPVTTAGELGSLLDGIFND